MKRIVGLLLKFALCFLLVDGVLLAALYVWDTGRGARAARQPVAIGYSHEQVVAILGEPSGQLKVGGAGTLRGTAAQERWFYGPMIRWKILGEPGLLYAVVTHRDPMLFGLAVFYHRTEPDARDLAIDFDTEGRVVHILRPQL